MNNFSFKIIAKGKKSKARAGKITTAHGTIDTPSFVAVGTRAAVRGLTPLDLKETGIQILFGNTYHLHLRPGEDVIQEFGGLGKFMGWDGPTMTDSGGFQVFSLARAALRSLRQFKNFSNASVPAAYYRSPRDTVAFGDSNEKFFHAKAPRALSPDVDEESAKLVKITDNGVTFRSHIDGSLHEFTPEKSIEIQQKLGADIILAFDECAPYPSTYEYTKQAMERTHRWAKRCLEEFKRLSSLSSRAKRGDLIRKKIASSHSAPRNDNPRQALYGIIQGGVYKDLREESAKFIVSLPFDGIAIGGVSVGESKKQMRNALDWVLPFLPEAKPRHLLGIGEIDDIFDSIEKGIDTFDCVIPTRLGRYGFVFVTPPEGNRKNKFMIDIRKSIFSKDKIRFLKIVNVPSARILQEVIFTIYSACRNFWPIDSLVTTICIL